MTEQNHRRITDGIHIFINPILMLAVCAGISYLVNLTVGMNERLIRMEERVAFMQTSISDLNIRVARLEVSSMAVQRQTEAR